MAGIAATGTTHRAYFARELDRLGVEVRTGRVSGAFGAGVNVAQRAFREGALAARALLSEQP